MAEYRVFPAEVTSGVPRVIVTGNGSAEVEQHRGLIRCEEDCISLRTDCGMLIISGHDMRLQRYTSSEACVRGCICSIVLENDEGRRK